MGNQMKSIPRILFLAPMLLAGCAASSEVAASKADKAETRANASVTIHLDKDAQEAIGLEFQKVARQPVPLTLQTTGWLLTPPGHQSVVKAATTGFYVSESADSRIEIGMNVSKGERLGTLRVFLSPQEEAQLVVAKEEADTLINQALVSKRLAEGQLHALESSEAKGVVSGTRILELQEIVQRNQIAYDEARERLPFLPTEPYADRLELRSVPIDSPIAGRITDVHAASRQFVVLGDPLWTVADWSTLWVRVPVFEGDAPHVVKDQSATLFQPGGASSQTAVAVPASQPTEPGRRTVDLLYQVENSNVTLRPGQAVSIDLPLGETRELVVVPRAAIVWDGMGNTWVYTRTGPETFRRVRVELGSGVDAMVAVERGLNEGDEIVCVGVQSLYGEEFKGQLQAEEVD